MKRGLAVALVTLSIVLAWTISASGEAKPLRVTFAVEAKGGWADKAMAALGNVKGVSKSEVLAKSQQVRVAYQPSQVTPQRIARELAKAGVPSRLLIQVEGMHWPGSWPPKVRALLSGVNGVRDVEIMFPRKQAAIAFADKGNVSLDTLLKALGSSGFFRGSAV